ncbi:hypothetical protein DFP72DRAFT_845272 [Ephemerocybe angulata]|uniref:Uncharacterized protein n=1 Tax=Ephemerocybe angulata TaxID=980116 RepID=A0A8H6MBS9_9AGAR|nr:hypothetical protein DFP72DRAFT_845272 [Tulosesus angulatus]
MFFRDVLIATPTTAKDDDLTTGVTKGGSYIGGRIAVFQSVVTPLCITSSQYNENISLQPWSRLVQLRYFALPHTCYRAEKKQDSVQNYLELRRQPERPQNVNPVGRDSGTSELLRSKLVGQSQGGPGLQKSDRTLDLYLCRGQNGVRAQRLYNRLPNPEVAGNFRVGRVPFESCPTTMDQNELDEFFQELCRKPTTQDMAEMTKNWARETWYTQDGESFYLRDMDTELIDLWIQNLKTRVSTFLRQGEPSTACARDKIDKILWLRNKSPAGYEPKVPVAEAGSIGTAGKFVWAWELETESPEDESSVMIDLFVDNLLSMRRDIASSCIQELQRRPTSADLVDLAREWALKTWYTRNGDDFFPREPGFDLPPSTLTEVLDLTYVHLRNLVDQMDLYKLYVEPKIQRLVETVDLGEDTKVEELLRLRNQAPAGYPSREPAGFDENGKLVFKWSWAKERTNATEVERFLSRLFGELLTQRMTVLIGEEGGVPRW